MVKICSVDGCGRSDRVVFGMCSMHYQRWKKHGAVDVVLPAPSGPSNGAWRRHVSYKSAHHRVWKARGKAYEHNCECGYPAEHWAYDHLDENELTGENRGYTTTYSTDPAHYIAMCVTCHKNFDLTYLKEIA